MGGVCGYMVATNYPGEKEKVALGVASAVLVVLWRVAATAHDDLSTHMNDAYPTRNRQLAPITSSDPVCEHALCDYFVYTAFTACNGAQLEDDGVDVGTLKALLRQGVRAVDFELYSIDNRPVVASSTSGSFTSKGTFNQVPFDEVMQVCRDYAFASGSSPTYSDPLIVHLRCKSQNQAMFANLAAIFKRHQDLMLGMEYSYEANGRNVCATPLLDLRHKIVLIVDRSNSAVLENKELSEYINATSNSAFVRLYDFDQVLHVPDVHELTEFNRQNMTVVVPNTRGDPLENPDGVVCRTSGCQLVAMMFQLGSGDARLAETTTFFAKARYAFALKPEALRAQPKTIDPPVAQNPDYSYSPRRVESDVYSFQV